MALVGAVATIAGLSQMGGDGRWLVGGNQGMVLHSGFLALGGFIGVLGALIAMANRKAPLRWVGVALVLVGIALGIGTSESVTEYCGGLPQLGCDID